MSLLQVNIFADGLEGKGYFPAVRFNRKNYLARIVKGEGAYIYYDNGELKRNTQAFHRDMTNGRCTPKKLRRLSERFFSDAKIAVGEFRGNLADMDNAALLLRFKKFRRAMTIGPIITVQLWGIESCWDPKFALPKFLEKRLGKLGKANDYQKCIEILSAGEGKSIPLLERESFLSIACRMKNNDEVRKAIQAGSATKIKSAFEKYPKLERDFSRHINEFAWTTTEYQSEPWGRGKWRLAMRREMGRDCKNELDELLQRQKNAVEENRKLLKRLQPPEKIMRILLNLEEFIRQRDWAKGEYSAIYLKWQPLLNELARRMGCRVEDVTAHTLDEIEEFLESGKNIPGEEIAQRKRGCIVISIGKPFHAHSNGLLEIERKEKLAPEGIEPKNRTEVFGIVGSSGYAKGRARVVRAPEEIDLVKNGEILITYMTTMEFTPVFKKVAAVVTDEGGLSSHAAIVSREFGLPCIVGTKRATKVFKTGDIVEVDARKGIVRKITP